MIRCRHLNPCFPHRVVQSMSPRDRRLYAFFHFCLWAGILTFAIGTGLYAALQIYAFLVMALPCICLMFVGQFGFRWLAIRNEDKFDALYQRDDPTDQSQLGRAAWPGAPPPPPIYTETYDGPIFTIDGTMEPPPVYEEIADQGQPADAAAAAAPKSEDGDADVASDPPVDAAGASGNPSI